MMSRKSWSRGTWGLVAGLVFAAFVAIALLAAQSARRLGLGSTRLAQATSQYSNTRPGVNYVGDASCAGCHEEITASYHRHSMGRSMALAAGSLVPGLEGKEGRVEFTARGLDYAIERKEGRIVHSETRKETQGGVITGVNAEVTYAVGSGRRGVSYLIERDGFLMQSPISWYSQQGRWDLSPDSLARNNHFERPIDPSCVFCHANQFEPATGTINGYRPPTFRGLSIGCERCHGPGELHEKSPGIGAGGFDPTIVNPRRLEPSLREDVCEQCHLGGRSRIERFGRTARDFRPGLPLGEFLAIFVDRKPARGRAKSIGHVEQMHSSRCFQASDGRLGCISCHDPHRLPAAETRVAYYRARCLDCHGTGDGCRLPEPARRQRSRDDSCIECHMPRSPLANVAHTAETDHGIPRHGETDKLPPIITEASGRDEPPLIAADDALFGSMKGASLDRELGIALAGLGADRASDRARLARFALPLLEAALKERPDDLVAWQAKIIALTLRGRSGDALAAAESSLALAPNHERSLSLAIPLLAGSGRRDEAIALGQRLLAVNPWFSEYHVVLAKLLGQAGRWSEAAEACRAALRLDPLNLTIRHILIKCALEMGDRTLARTEAEVYLRFDLDEGERNTVMKWLEQAR
jgi:Flp pilus assembly protein TadD